MADLHSRRDLFGQMLAGGIAVQLPRGAEDGRAAALVAATTLNDIVALARFADADQLRLPDRCSLVWTSGHSQPGKGGACYRRETIVDRAYVRSHPRTAFLDAAGRGFRLYETEVDVSQTGAIGDGTADDTAAIQEALVVVEAGGGGTVMLPAGTYKTTAPLRIPPRTGIRGAGPSSLLQANSCDGILLGASDEIGPRTLSDFAIRGQGGERFTAIVVEADDDRRAQGIVFERLYLSFFGTGVRSRGLWHATFRTITVNQIWTGFVLTGRNVKITIDDCRLTHGGLLRGTGDPIGIQVGDGSSKLRPEDVQVTKSIIYGFGKGIVWRTALFGSVTQCDLDACTRIGLELVTADGGFTFANNWVHVDGPSARGIDCTALGYEPQNTSVHIVNNSINGRIATLGSCGIVIGNQQSDLVIEGNAVSSAWESGIRADGVRRLSLVNNKVARDIVAEGCTAIVVARNFAGAGLRLNNNVSLESGSGFGPHSGRIIGTLIIPAGKATHSVTFASLRLPDLPEGSYRTILTLDPGLGSSSGEVRGRATRTGIVIETARASSQENRVAFRVEAY
ncbi:glycosyl hydrolase family 28-related protein [Sphingomonas sp. 179-A 2A2 NHS]|uniref:glycosyl hydrolase family 28-related protein n=1 Tax=Sphingomonas sp. 179-A 2A2 NHS TaxID=3374290 RepID=UPI0038790BB3